MEGDGPLNGTEKKFAVLLFADDPVLADSTLASMLGIQPNTIKHIREAGRFIGNDKGHWL